MCIFYIVQMGPITQDTQRILNVGLKNIVVALAASIHAVLNRFISRKVGKSKVEH
jgi:hypothetical protein